MPFKILSINPGSTSSKIAVYEDENPVFVETIQHKPEELDQFDNLLDQFELRRDYVLKALDKNGVKPESLSAVVGRGGLLPPVRSGGYFVNQAMLDVLRVGRIHASNLGAYIAQSIGSPLGIPVYIYDAVASDELCDLARISGFPGVERRSLSHTLNAKAAARKVAAMQGGSYSEKNFVVTHMGGGISTTAHEQGRMIDVVSDDEGTFSPERSGRMPYDPLIELCLSGKFTQKQIMDKLKKTAGLMGHLGTNDCLEVQRRISEGDEKAKLIYDAMIYQIAKDIGSMAAVLRGKVDAVILTGGMSYSEYITGALKERVSFIAPVMVIAGENEMESLTLGALRMLKGEEPCNEFSC